MALHPTPTTRDFERADRLVGVLNEAGISLIAYEMHGSTVIFHCEDMAQARAALIAVTRRGFGIRARAQKHHGVPSLIIRP